MRRICYVIALFLVSAVWQPLYAGSAGLVETLAERQDYFGALLAYERLPEDKRDKESTVAAARSAWALGLPNRAAQEFDRALSLGGMDNVERARLLLSRGIIELQEGRNEAALFFAEQMLAELRSPSPLRAKGSLLKAEALYKTGSFLAAEDNYTEALSQSSDTEKPEVYFLRAQCRMRAGKDALAVEDLKQVPTKHERAAEALRMLATLALQERAYDQAKLWLNKGRELFPQQFADSWVDYSALQVAMAEHNAKRVREILAAKNTKDASHDAWVMLLNAQAESFLWKESAKQSKPKE
jgi:tetratricopeptide (TPR) repeat protein